MKPIRPTKPPIESDKKGWSNLQCALMAMLTMAVIMIWSYIIGKSL